MVGPRPEDSAIGCAKRWLEVRIASRRLRALRKNWEVELMPSCQVRGIAGRSGPDESFSAVRAFRSYLIGPQSLAPFVESDHYFPRYGLRQEGAAVRRSHRIGRIIALTAHRSYGSHEDLPCDSCVFSTSDGPRCFVTLES